ncbi:hypothetical protein [Helicobacter fennelliae]|uniref:Uncharacterized protein n=1 Tax=Helicobacter fennelliae MRY12-0050 TaxID=1325130 RepID=T1DX57_9HELI|nr:hypothetical protein [Helicobacter fennelliae]GAD19962.1 hypothetical protein HFN_1206 [Helicobacter fennelliae MRY12-0050]
MIITQILSSFHHCFFVIIGFFVSLLILVAHKPQNKNLNLKFMLQYTLYSA